MSVRDRLLQVALIWSLLPAFGALPLYLHIKDPSWTDAYFEAVSGLTANGATVLSGLDHLPLSIMGLGGFSTKDASLGHLDSLEIELPDLGLHLVNATRPARNLHAAGSADARLLAALSGRWRTRALARPRFGGSPALAFALARMA